MQIDHVGRVSVSYSARVRIFARQGWRFLGWDLYQITMIYIIASLICGGVLGWGSFDCRF